MQNTLFWTHKHFSDILWENIFKKKEEEKMNWLALSFIAVLCWGVGSFTAKLAGYFGAKWKQIYAFELIGIILVALVVLSYLMFFERKALAHTILSSSWEITISSLMIGITWGIATIVFIVALTKGPATIIVPLTASYPLVTVLLVLACKRYFHESMDLIKILGILFTLGGVILLSISKK